MSRSRFTDSIAGGSYYARKRNRVETSLITDVTAPAWGTVTFGVNPTSGDTATINGTVLTFGTTFAIGASLAATLLTAATYVAAHAISGVGSVSVSGNGLLVLSAKPADTSITLAASAGTVSHSTLQVQQVNARTPL